METRAVLTTAAIAGLITAVVSSIPLLNLFNLFFCFWLWFGGGFAVWLYQSREHKTLDTGQAAILGLATGAATAIIGALVGFVFGSLGFGLMSLADTQNAPAFLDTLAISGLCAGLGIFINIFFYPVFSMLGAIIAAQLKWK